MVRSPAPARQLLCVKCGRDTTTSSPLPNGSRSSAPTVTETDRPPNGYHPFVNGDDMDSDEDEPEAGVMQDDGTSGVIDMNQLDRKPHIAK